MIDTKTRHVFATMGAAGILAAIVGGGMTVAGMEMPVIPSVPAQIAVGIASLILLIAGVREPRLRTKTFAVTHPRSSISVAKGTIAKPEIKTTYFGGGTELIEAVDFHQTDDGAYVFTDARRQPVRQLPKHAVATISVRS